MKNSFEFRICWFEFLVNVIRSNLLLVSISRSSLVPGLPREERPPFGVSPSRRVPVNNVKIIPCSREQAAVDMENYLPLRQVTLYSGKLT